MRKLSTLWPVVLIPVFMLGSCSKELYDEAGRSTQSKRTFTVSDARRVFDENSSQTRSQDDQEVLTVGYFYPYWEDGMASSDGRYLNNVDVPVESQYIYRSVGYNNDGEMTLNYIHHKLVVVQGVKNGESYPYILFYMPSEEYAQSHSQEVYSNFLNGNKKDDFTGMAIYTTLDGLPVCTGRYDNGKLENSAFLNDSTQTPQYNYAKMIDMLDEVRVARCRIVQTRTEVDTVTAHPGGDIEVVEILGKPRPKKEPTLPYKYVQTEDPIGGNTTTGGSGGTPNGDSTPPPPTSPVPNLPTADLDVIEELNELLEDCMGQVLLNSINKKISIITGPTARGNAYIHSDNHTSTPSRIEIVNIKDIIIMEEIIHAYQYQGVTIADYGNSKLNNEIEAKLGWYMYRERIRETEGLDRALGGKEGINAFRKMSENFRNDNMHGIMFQGAYNDAAQALRAIKGYKDPSKYPFAEGDFSVKKLIELMKNCLEKK